MTIQERIQALGDVVILVDKYLQDNLNLIQEDDAFNPAGFEADKIESNWGWYFQSLPKPTLEQLEQIKQELEA